ncbi:MAG: adenine phosphoribosyltransferase [Gemmatimonadaceae bacterium]
MSDSLEVRLERVLRVVPDFPKPGIRFRDISPLLANPVLMREVVTVMNAPFLVRDISHIVGIESRGFLFGLPMALELGVPFVLARKPGKLPSTSVRESFTLEYGSDALEIHADALSDSSRVLIVDDILATGGTVAAACRLVERLGAKVVGVSVLGEIAGLCEPSVLAGRDVHAIVSL